MTDPIVEILKLIKEDQAWLPELYSVIANSELIMPMVLGTGDAKPSPIGAPPQIKKTAAYNPFYKKGYEDRSPNIFREYCLVYSNRDIFKSVEPILHLKCQGFGVFVDPLIRNGRQIINMCCRLNKCAVINFYASDALQYPLSFEQMLTIQRTQVIARPKTELQKDVQPAAPQDEALQKSVLEEEKERDLQPLQAHLKEQLKENARLEAENGIKTRIISE